MTITPAEERIEMAIDDLAQIVKHLSEIRGWMSEEGRAAEVNVAARQLGKQIAKLDTVIDLLENGY